MTSSYKLLPDEEPGPEDEAQRALIKVCLQVMQEMREDPDPSTSSGEGWLNKLDTLKVTKEDK